MTEGVPRGMGSQTEGTREGLGVAHQFGRGHGFTEIKPYRPIK
jgi:hypothetical protein